MLSVLFRVAGIGDGLFVIFFFIGLSLLICFFGAKTANPGLFCCLSTVLSLVVVLFMVLVPKEKASFNPTPTEYDPGYTRRIIMILLLAVFALIALVMVMAELCVPKLQGSKVRPLEDRHRP